MASQLTNLLCLLVCDIGCLGEIVINNLLVGLVDEWRNESDCGSKKSKTPKRNKLDQEVGNEGSEESLESSEKIRGENVCSTYSSRNSNILNEENALRLNHEEVDKFMDVRGERIKSRLGDGIILLGAELGCQPGGQD